MNKQTNKEKTPKQYKITSAGEGVVKTKLLTIASGKIN
jgi:hypothetical protein